MQERKVKSMECPICGEEGASLPWECMQCRAPVHSACMLQWLMINPTCPFCKAQKPCMENTTCCFMCRLEIADPDLQATCRACCRVFHERCMTFVRSRSDKCPACGEGIGPRAVYYPPCEGSCGACGEALLGKGRASCPKCTSPMHENCMMVALKLNPRCPRCNAVIAKKQKRPSR